MRLCYKLRCSDRQRIDRSTQQGYGSKNTVNAVMVDYDLRLKLSKRGVEALLDSADGFGSAPRQLHLTLQLLYVDNTCKSRRHNVYCYRCFTYLSDKASMGAMVWYSMV